jgi:MoxR-like ATPase
VSEQLTINDVASQAGAVLDEIEKAVVGKRTTLELIMAGLLADGHVLLEDVPGVAKTLIARSMATVTGLDFSRVQFTPDLIPSDLTGSLMPAPNGTARFVPGPLFANLVLGDEINRAPSKTQAAALEAMEERQVTVDGESHPLPKPYFLLATQNPIETEGTYPLPEAQLDRFLLRTGIGYPGPEAERDLLRRRLDRGTDQPMLLPITNADGVRAMQVAVETVEASTDIVDYVVNIIEATREHDNLEVGSSPRGGLALLKVSRAKAALAGRNFVTPDDVKSLAIPTLAHRLVLRTEAWVRGVREDNVVSECVEKVPTPASLTDADRAASGA